MAGPTLIGFTGHQGLEAHTEEAVDAALRALLVDAAPVVGICSLAEGGDQIFARAVLDAEGSLIVVVPCRGYEQTFSEGAALADYQSLLSKAARVIELDFPEPSEDAFWSAGKRVVQEAEQVVAVWDGQPAGGLGGTADVVSYAQSEGRPVTIVWPDGARRS